MPRARIAVPNDDTALLGLVKEALTDEGYEVHTSLEWANAYEPVRDEFPDLVILDLIMGREEQGWEVLELLRLDRPTAGIPIIVSAAARDRLLQKADRLRQLAAEPLEKPFDLDEPLCCIEELLERSPLGSGAKQTQEDRGKAGA